MPFVNLGLCPEFGASLLLPRLLGHARAARLLLWGDGLDGTQAVALGLANEAFEDGEQCLAAAQKMAQRCNMPSSLALASTLFRRSINSRFSRRRVSFSASSSGCFSRRC